MKVDPFTLEIIREQLIAAAEESFIAFGRSSQSPIIYEVLDYACAITDADGDLIAVLVEHGYDRQILES